MSLVLHCLERDVSRRFASSEQVAAALEALAHPSAVVARRPQRRRSLLLAGSAIAAAALVGVALYAALQHRPASVELPPPTEVTTALTPPARTPPAVTPPALTPPELLAPAQPVATPPIVEAPMPAQNPATEPLVPAVSAAEPSNACVRRPPGRTHGRRLRQQLRSPRRRRLLPKRTFATSSSWTARVRLRTRRCSPRPPPAGAHAAAPAPAEQMPPAEPPRAHPWTTGWLPRPPQSQR